MLRPMRAFKIEEEHSHKLKFPLLGQFKYDGIRAIFLDGVALSNTLLPIRNPFVQELAATHRYNGMDCELLSGSNFQETSSNIMSSTGTADFQIKAFDMFDQPELLYLWRHDRLVSLYVKQNDPRLEVTNSCRVKDWDELLSFNMFCLERGHEGSIYRSPKGLYKYGRSTLNESYLLKNKPFCDAEAQIVGFVEQEENLNLLELDARGYAKRSSAQEFKVGKNTLGAFIVRSPVWGTFAIGTGKGLTKELRQKIWDNQEDYLHQILTFTYQKYGTKDKPRIPVFKNFRHMEDTLVRFD